MLCRGEGGNLLKYGFILNALYQQSNLNFDNEEHRKPPPSALVRGVHIAQQHAAGGNRGVISHTHVHL